MNRARATQLLAWLLASALGCVGVPEGIEPVRGFDIERYLGTWYELARYDHRFERGLDRVSATYALLGETPAEGISVVNRGFDPRRGEWREAHGRAFFVQEPGTGHLKVSFFGPFYASYVVFALDPGYGWAWVTGFDRSYLWLLSRDPAIDEARYQELLAIARDAGFDTGALLRVSHGPPESS